ncbi:site-specific integrase [Neobacillus sp. NPDC093182]|uniref:site-specific integrase n=1 Tax=Neobacillus sp. NPDC093182 TaxID=3364297 RepID=UPI003800A9A9
MTKARKVKRIVAQAEEKTIREMYEDFQLANRIKNLSGMTIRFYEQNLVRFFRFLDDVSVADITAINKQVVDQYILSMKRKELKDTTINTYLRAARALL